MSFGPALVELIGRISNEPSGEKSLEEIAEFACRVTGSSNSMVAILNEELGCLELLYGAGEEFERARDSKFRVDIGQEEGIVAYVAATGSPLISGNVEEVPSYRKVFPTTQSELAVPVRDRFGRIVGVLNLESSNRDAYGEDARSVAVGLAHLISVVLDRMDRAEREEALIEIGGALDRAQTDDEMVQRVIRVAGEVLRFQACSIFLFDPNRGAYVLRGTTGRLKDEVGKLAYQAGEGCTGWVCANGLPILLHDPQTDPRWRGKYTEVPSDQIAGFLAVPISGRSGPIGAIRVLRRKTDNPYLDNRFTDDDMRLLQAIAEQVSTGLESMRNLQKIIRGERMAAWGELSAKSSHMIGNRVFALKGDVNELKHVLADEQPSMDSVRELQQSIETNVMRIDEILQDFRDFLTATQIKREPTDFNLLVKETVSEVFPKMSDVRLELELDPAIPTVEVDQRRLRRAVSELIENSLNYVEGGFIRISTKLSSGAEHPESRLAKYLRIVEVDVEDSGPGVQPEQKSQIFQPFFSGRVKGMGLGLSIVRGIAEAHGGEVKEVGASGSGAQFVLLLPVGD